jgi:hypothetical protein
MQKPKSLAFRFAVAVSMGMVPRTQDTVKVSEDNFITENEACGSQLKKQNDTNETPQALNQI